MSDDGCAAPCAAAGFVVSRPESSAPGCGRELLVIGAQPDAYAAQRRLDVAVRADD
jgi:hypothetical protein